MRNCDEEQPCLVFVSWSVSTLATPARLKRLIWIPVWDKDSGQPKDEFCSELQIHSKTKALCVLLKVPTFSFFRTELTSCACFVLRTRNPFPSFSVTEKNKSGNERHCFHTASLPFVRLKRRGSASYLPCVALVYGNWNNTHCFLDKCYEEVEVAQSGNWAKMKYLRLTVHFRQYKLPPHPRQGFKKVSLQREKRAVDLWPTENLLFLLVYLILGTFTLKVPTSLDARVSVTLEENSVIIFRMKFKKLSSVLQFKTCLGLLIHLHRAFQFSVIDPQFTTEFGVLEPKKRITFQHQQMVISVTINLSYFVVDQCC